MKNSTNNIPDARRFWRHAGGLGVIGAIIALALGAAFMSIGNDQRSRDLPIAAVGSPAAAQALEAQAPGELSVQPVADRAAATEAIEERDVYAAVVLGPKGVRELMIAPAANNGVANGLRRTLGQATPDNAPRITDVKPLPDDDASGVDISLLLTVLIIGGSVAVVGIGRILPRLQGDPRRGVLPIAFLVQEEEPDAERPVDHLVFHRWEWGSRSWRSCRSCTGSSTRPSRAGRARRCFAASASRWSPEPRSWPGSCARRSRC